jgi:tetratricopeptide (TPR) repeat protein
MLSQMSVSRLGRGAVVLGLATALTAGFVCGKARAQGSASESQTRAQQHFAHARELYQAGNYKDAATELELALTLDPNAKDLVYNLGIVHEKLGRIDESIGYFRRYATMDVTPQEKARADAILVRLEGAKQRQIDSGATGTSGANASAPSGAPPTAGHATDSPAGEGSSAAAASAGSDTAPPASKNGRVDTATIMAGALAGMGLGAGAVFGVLAVTGRPSSPVTRQGFTYDDLVKQSESAHTEAVVADVALGIGAVAAAATAYLYFARPALSSGKNTTGARPAGSGKAPEASAAPWCAPLVGGAAVGVGGRF